MFRTTVACTPKVIKGSVVAAALALSTTATAPRADAAVYKLYTCNVPGRQSPVPMTAPWKAELAAVHAYVFDECAAGRSFGVGLNIKSMAAFEEASLVLERPAEGPMAAIGIIRYKTWITAELAGSGAPAFVVVGGNCGPPGCVTADDQPWVSPPYTHDNSRVAIRLNCTAGDCAFESGRPLQVRGVEADLYEDVPPTGAIEGGSLIDEGAAGGLRTLSIRASDHESGVGMVEALLGDTVVARHDLESNAEVCPHTTWNACPLTYATNLMVDTTRLSPGTHVLTLRVTDAAGNRRLVTASKPVTVARPEAGAGSLRLTAAFGESRFTHTTNFGRSVLVRGRLALATGEPIARGRIAITETTQTQNGRRRVLSTFVATASDGRFAYRASGRRPSREIRFQYAARGRPTVSRRLRLKVRAASTLSVSLRGVMVRYAGRVLSKPIPAGGKTIFMQGRAMGGSWQRFAVRRTDSRGRFSGRYRLRVRRPGVRLQFRIEVPRQHGYLFVPRVGAAVTRVVR